ncbi:MAG: alpha/beta hydrolase [Mesorhizobium sp.]|nr:alpha/beta hydrolase [Mesorhizobium sp. M1D.F.Ca.ET.043.01.1.1]RWA96812.1 MAG: alpha/beta hydrolase [Mesorhizobium sp.]RWE09835.1 MAG: alpha/beta hydrolase [Mesorhizobium sp.]TJW88563.1 MAG: alpha/beta hydrolase [Mesorhizobium sp.]
MGRKEPRVAPAYSSVQAVDVHRLTAILSLAFLAGCLAPDRIAYGPKVATVAGIDGFRDIRTYADVAREQADQRPWLPITKNKEINYLALSSGGGAGAFSVGALKAWSAAGTRPQFDIVSGVSTGALIAPYAFLGSAYDKTLTDLYTSGVAETLVDADFLPKGLFGASLLKQQPLRTMVERYLTRDVLAKIAAEHRKGRRLHILTSNLDSQRAVIWNMGAIADSGRPDALKLFQDVIIASASIPGVYPAVLIKARSGERAFEEMHSDGGAVSQILTIPEGWMAGPDKDEWREGRRFNMYILINNALMPEFSTTTNNTFVVMARANSTLIKSQTRSALLATYLYAQKNGIRFHVGSIDMQVPYKMADPFNTHYMRVLYSLGYAKMASGHLWQDKPLFTENLAAAQPSGQEQ